MPKVISMDLIKELREKTNAGVMDAKRALEESNGDMKKAEDWIREKGIQRAEKKAGREAKQGVIASYVHQGAQVVALVELNCETDLWRAPTSLLHLVKKSHASRFMASFC